MPRQFGTIRGKDSSYNDKFLMEKIAERYAVGETIGDILESLGIDRDKYIDLRNSYPEFSEHMASLDSRALPTEAVEIKLRKLFERGEGDVHRYVDKVTDKTAAQIAEKMGDALSRGLTFEQACIFVSVNPIDIRKYAEKNPDFFRQINEAEIKFSMYLIDKIMGHARDNWKAAAWLLERKYPEKWAEVKSVDINKRAAIEKTTQVRDSSHLDKPTIDVTKMSDDELQKALQQAR